MEDLRNEIDKIDSQIIRALKKRNDMVEQIARLKEQNGYEVHDEDRWGTHMKELLTLAGEKELDQDTVTEIWSIIHRDSCRKQKEIISKGNTNE